MNDGAPFRSTLMSLLDISVPIISAPMAFVAGGSLAAAVSEAGGLGLLGGGYGDRAWLDREWNIADGARIGVGFITWMLEKQPDLLSYALERNPAAIFLSFGSVRGFADEIVRSGIPLIAQVQSVTDARIAVSEGASVIVAQGTEAGGHCGSQSTITLVPAIVDAVSPTPVVAAGGIADGRGLAAALMLGAQAIVCGTAFYASRESLAHPNAKNMAIGASGDQTVRSDVFDRARGYDWPVQWKARALKNDFHRHWSATVPDQLGKLELMQAEYQRAIESADLDKIAVFVGEAVTMVRTQDTACSILQRIVNDARACMSDCM